MPTQEHRLRLWTKDFGLGLLICLCFYVGFDALIPVLPLYAAEQGAVGWQIGVIVGAQGLAAAVLRPLTGRATELWGTRLVTGFGSVLFGLTMVAFMLLPSPLYLLLLRLVQGAAAASFWTASVTLVADLVPPLRMGEAVAYLGISSSVVQALAPPLAVVMAAEWGYGVLFLGCAATAVLSVLTTFLVHPGRDISAARVRSPLINRRALLPASIFLSFTVTTGPVFAFLPLFAATRSLGNPGLYFTAFGATATLVRLFVGRLSDLYGRAPIVAPTLLIAAVAMFMLAVATSQEMFLASGLVYGIALGGIYVGLLALTIDRATPETRGSAMSTFLWAWDIGNCGGATALGFVAGSVDYAIVFAMAGGFPLLGLAAFVVCILRGI